jgi:large subunit ribosomal protein L23
MKDSRLIVKKIQITEKSARLAEKENKYFFLVAGSVNKLEIKRAVEELYKVSVSKVNTVNYRGKLKRERTMTYGRTAGWKRAIVTLAEGSKIELT